MVGRLFFYVVIPALAGVAGYRATDAFFRYRVIPYPSEPYGMAVGMALFFWTLGLAIWIRGSVLRQKKDGGGGGGVKTLFMGTGIIVLAGALLLATGPGGLHAEEDEDASGTVTASNAEIAALSDKLDRVLNELENVKAELQVIKIRSTR